MIPVVSERACRRRRRRRLTTKARHRPKSAAKTKTGARKRLIKMAEMYLSVRRKPTTKAAGLDRRRNKQIRDRRLDRQEDGREPAEVSGTAPA